MAGRAPNMKHVTLAKELFNYIVQKQYDKLVPHYNPMVRKVLTNDLLASSWKTITATTGHFQSITSVCPITASLIQIQCKCEKIPMKVIFCFDENDLVSGLNFDQVSEFTIPSYVKEDLFTEEEIEVGEGKWKLPGKITIPRSPETVRHPCVILVHGSGSHDEDETIGPNKPFRDIAFGLASRGIASIRYAKRNFQYGQSLTPDEISNFTLMEETVEDAVEAVKVAQKHPNVDNGAVFVLGHSLGGYATPLIGKLGAEKIRGLISLAGNIRNLADMALDQMTYLHSLNNGNIDEKTINYMKKVVKNVHDPMLSETTPKDQLMNIFPKYWLFLQGYDPIATAQSISLPFLVLHAGRDYQVTNDDFQFWKQLEGSGRVTYKEYPGLNHLMMTCDPALLDKKATPEEYNTHGSVDEGVIADIFTWIQNNK